MVSRQCFLREIPPDRRETRLKTWRGRQESAPQQRAAFIVDSSVPQDALLGAHEIMLALADTLREPVTFAVSDGWLEDEIPAATRSRRLHVLDAIQPTVAATNVPMGSAPFVYRDDGLPDWSSMWTGFCELALMGGPPHRGLEAELRAPREAKPAVVDRRAIEEIKRGIWETTGLVAAEAEPGWISVNCDSPKMAAWLCAAIILENVEARCEGSRLFLPASPDFSIKDEVKGIITVLAKTNHYWNQHIKTQAVSCDTVALVMRQQEALAG
jgi:hypothetical protein